MRCCTCLGYCRGPEGLARGWYCALRGEALALWVVYAKPLDFPEEFVGRRFVMVADGRYAAEPWPFARGESIAAVRARLPRGLVCIGRDPRDDPAIAEVWV